MRRIKDKMRQMRFYIRSLPPLFKAFGASTKELMEKIFSLGYGIYRIETEYPCDHICVPLEKVDYFELQVLKNYRIPTSKMIYGKLINVYFSREGDQNYKAVEILN